MIFYYSISYEELSKTSVPEVSGYRECVFYTFKKNVILGKF